MTCFVYLIPLDRQCNMMISIMFKILSWPNIELKASRVNTSTKIVGYANESVQLRSIDGWWNNPDWLLQDEVITV